MTKREVLLAICEHPGWQPPDSSSAGRFLEELQEEGWILPRLDGFEGSPRALDEFPRFESQKDIADPHTSRMIPDAFREKPEAVVERIVPMERVVILLVSMLQQLPLPVVELWASKTASQLPPEEENAAWSFARQIAERMAR